MRSVDPSSSVTVPLPDQTPAMPAKGPDWAWPVELTSRAPAHITAVRIADRRTFRIAVLPNYCREASQRPLQGIPPEAPFHLPDPALPLSWPLAEAPLNDTRTAPPLPTVPEMGAPAAVTLPSATVTG